MIAYLDTNTVIFLHSGQVERISRRAQVQLENSDLLISPVVLLELEMLYERGRLRFDADKIVADLSRQIGLAVCQLPLATVIASALPLKWTRDPADRLIVANAHANNEAPLVTSDRVIQDNYSNAIW